MMKRRKEEKYNRRTASPILSYPILSHPNYSCIFKGLPWLAEEEDKNLEWESHPFGCGDSDVLFPLAPLSHFCPASPGACVYRMGFKSYVFCKSHCRRISHVISLRFLRLHYSSVLLMRGGGGLGVCCQSRQREALPTLPTLPYLPILPYLIQVKVSLVSCLSF